MATVRELIENHPNNKQGWVDSMKEFGEQERKKGIVIGYKEAAKILVEKVEALEDKVKFIYNQLPESTQKRIEKEYNELLKNKYN